MVGKAHKWGIFKLRGLLLHPMPLSLRMPPPMELPLYVYVQALFIFSPLGGRGALNRTLYHLMEWSLCLSISPLS